MYLYMYVQKIYLYMYVQKIKVVYLVVWCKGILDHNTKCKFLILTFLQSNVANPWHLKL